MSVCCKNEYLLHLSIYHYIKAPKMATTCSYLFHHKRFRDTFPTDGTANTTGSLSWPYTRPSSQWAREIGPGSTSIVPTTPQTGHRCTQVAHDVRSNPCLYRFLLWLILGASSNAEESMDGDAEMMRNFFASCDSEIWIMGNEETCEVYRNTNP